MLRLLQKMKKKTGLSPGTPVYTGECIEEQTELRLITYSSEKMTISRPETWRELHPLLENSDKKWLHITGLCDGSLIKKLCDHLGIHVLVQEDILNTIQRPKVEEFDDLLFLTFKQFFNNTENQVMANHTSLLLLDNLVLSFAETRSPALDPILRRMENPSSRIRTFESNYLIYALLDAIVDSYFLTLEEIGSAIEEYEEQALFEPQESDLQKIYSLRREILYFHKSVWPVRELINTTSRMESRFSGNNLQFFLRDLYDHVIQIIETADVFRDMISNVLDLQLSSASNRMNEIMKVLTIIATIFIPLTFMAGIYGMNFTYMPELDWRYGYFAFWGVMLLVFMLLLVYFKKKKWLGK